MDYDFNTLITQAQSGDKEAFNAIIANNKYLIFHATKGIYSAYNDKEDINQIGYIGLIKAINTYKRDKKFEFSTYAVTCIKNEVNMVLRKDKKLHSFDSLDKQIDIAETGSKISLVDMIEDKSIRTDSDVKIDLHNAIKRLKEGDRNIIEMIYFKNMNQVQVAEILGISKSYVSRIVERILKSMRRYVTA